MTGTIKGGLKVVQSLRQRLGSDEAVTAYYKEIGARGGRNGHTGGFAANPELARIAGKKGGTISRPTKKIL